MPSFEFIFTACFCFSLFLVLCCSSNLSHIAFHQNFLNLCAYLLFSTYFYQYSNQAPNLYHSINQIDFIHHFHHFDHEFVLNLILFYPFFQYFHMIFHLDIRFIFGGYGWLSFYSIYAYRWNSLCASFRLLSYSV